MAKLVNKEEYNYKNIELTPSIFKELLIELFDGKQFSRQNAIETIVEHHMARGGTANKSSYVSTFKRAYQYLKNSGMTNVASGIYRLNHVIDTVEYPQNKSDQYILPEFDNEYGDGSEFVYLYYFDIYKRFAESKNKSSWECKIGRTGKEAFSRIISQTGTSYPEMPHFALLLKCNNSLALEASIHNILKARNEWISDSPGKEWFITNPSEVIEIYNFIIESTTTPECGEEKRE